MVGIVLVSHSRALATAAKELAMAMAGPKLAIGIAAGAGDNRAELGTDAMEILECINTVMGEEGALILMDMGSAILSAETALGFLDDATRAKVRCSAAPFIEGAVAASVIAALGSSLEDVAKEAEQGLRGKREHLQPAESAAENEPAEPRAAGSAATATIRVTIQNPHGLHARPAARLIREAAKFTSKIEARNVTKQRGPQSLRSLSSLVSLEVSKGDEMELLATGEDAGDAVKSLRQAIEGGLGDALPNAQAESGEKAEKNAPKAASRIVAVSPGIAIGPLYFSKSGIREIPQQKNDDPAAEKRKLQEALNVARTDLKSEQTSLKESVGDDEAAIMEAQILILEDPALLARVDAAIEKDHANAAQAWHSACEEVAREYEALTDEYIRQRAADVRDTGTRVLKALGVAHVEIAQLTKPGILVVDDLAPSEVANLPKDTVLGVVCLQGGKTSHAAILLRARGLPAIARAKAELDRAGIRGSSGEIFAAIDGERGSLWISPDKDTLRRLEAQRDEQQRKADEERAASRERAMTKDGHTVTIWANLGSPRDADAAVEQGAEGVGLFRTEFLFLNRAAAPSEEDQFLALDEARRKMGDRPVIIRTLDIGGDKALPYLELPREANPFLGVRALRLCFTHPELFQPHLRAILRAGHGGDFRVMFPMVADPTEFREARLLLEEAHSQLTAEGIPHLWPIPVGIMIEIPSAVILIDQFAPLADFFSIGTNDLTQYVLAADRSNPELAQFQDTLHPAVLRQIHQATTAAHKHGKEIGVCGESASDPDAAKILIGLGVDELSLSAARIPRIKAAIRSASKRELEALAAKAMTLENAAQVRVLVGESKASK